MNFLEGGGETCFIVRYSNLIRIRDTTQLLYTLCISTYNFGAHCWFISVRFFILGGASEVHYH
jgi:hypothetical protein